MLSIQTLKNFMEVTSANSGLIEVHLPSVVSDFESRTRRYWSPRDNQVEIIKVDQSQRRRKFLFTYGYPCREVPEVELDTIQEFQTLETTDAGALLNRGTDFDFDRSTGTLENLRVDYNGEVVTPWGRKVVIATGDVGYDTDEAPADVLAAIARELEFRLLRNSPDRVLIQDSSLNSNGATSARLVPLDSCHPEFLRAAAKYARRASNY